MEYNYKTKGTCSRQIKFQLSDNVIHNVEFQGGCHGNLQGITKLVEGMNVDQVVEKLENIKCGDKSTSCPDQLAQALKQAKKES